MSGQTRGLPLLCLPGETLEQAQRSRKAGYQRDFRRKRAVRLTLAADAGIPVSGKKPGILELVNVRG